MIVILVHRYCPAGTVGIDGDQDPEGGVVPDVLAWYVIEVELIPLPSDPFVPSLPSVPFVPFCANRTGVDHSVLLITFVAVFAYAVAAVTYNGSDPLGILLLHPLGIELKLFVLNV